MNFKLVLLIILKKRYLCEMKFNLRKYYELLGNFFIDAAKIIMGSVVIVPFFEKDFTFQNNWITLVIGFSCTMALLILGLYISKK
jgi:hypothetical protein